MPKPILSHGLYIAVAVLNAIKVTQRHGWSGFAVTQLHARRYQRSDYWLSKKDDWLTAIYSYFVLWYFCKENQYEKMTLNSFENYE